jgi:hypothetical protein
MCETIDIAFDVGQCLLQTMAQDTSNLSMALFDRLWYKNWMTSTIPEHLMAKALTCRAAEVCLHALVVPVSFDQL